MRKLLKTTCIASVCLFLLQISVDAQSLKVAIAANLQPVIKVLQKDFKQKTGITVAAISGPSGNLATQIQNGAPFDVFLSADTRFPDNLYKSGYALKAPVVYAGGVLIICSTKKFTYNNWPKLLTSNNIEKIAIGNPAIAPYGKAAEEALKKAGIYDKVKPKIVLGESITQVNTYISTGVVQIGFTTLAFTKEVKNKFQLTYALVDPNTYPPIKQGMVLLKHAEHNTAAEKFYQYILSAPAKKIFKAYGYHVQ
ncbi:molybdate ABC transporter substrate-binding protein [Mucilaginibacter sp.]|jgi:molybdate transport system substrate-binding protein|uniref:molybdate ABC transporter substrate-binding protein n=1 Tax=Mucilaginibacter sp. TaxID=1882438 RepID=UPI0035676A58